MVHSYQDDVTTTAAHLHWPEAKVRAAVHYAKAFPEEIDRALEENQAVDFTALKQMLPQAIEFPATK